MLGKCYLCRAIVATSMFLRINVSKLLRGSPREVDDARLRVWRCRSAEIYAKAVERVIRPSNSPCLWCRFLADNQVVLL